MIYRKYSDFLREKFGEKVYKLPVKLDLTCPNRDGTCGFGGCIFCGEEGGSFENNNGSVREQLLQNKEHIKKKYKANKYIAYFQNFTNTYMEFDDFKKVIEESLIEDVVGVSISTRPDYLPQRHLDYLEELSKEYFVTVEIGLQTPNYHSLKKLNRGHGLSEFIDAVLKLKKRNINVCTHIIIGLPWDDNLDIVECAKILNVLDIDEVKIHALYILKDTALGDMYEKEEIKPISLKDYENKVILFLRNLKDDIIVERIIGRAPYENSLFCNWNTSWWKIRDEIVMKMQENGYTQGDLVKGEIL
ncbi:MULTISPECIES: TIGR01212 family radical SAM protein [Peptoniphilus]|uniref:TIGR01212 family radical SAM protein n=1 Tax=Peptoniphilus TaxID=162289 RepID=UPI000289D3FF|nr:MULTISPECIES: TIGR01212 family radical SAM protein [Peptoniphilus]MDU1043844.1 TIGR01212 family radical SAM protein [Peptoniphilus rhinitidis]MDU1954663.1 TIGR01212 family radical SAM protein [Peptoniphilus lacydonensis]MDU2110397.1 TIGR01212 family radical SAM protein [Peptoniphilus lacydonensis]MDU2115811.1 TIGR01212 family radical SAM protein [Peptoniphilus lacydonensis]MDU3751028.1 TIGR01212 family radical SAM protein [Peptoniphilus rhinitidis]